MACCSTTSLLALKNKSWIWAWCKCFKFFDRVWIYIPIRETLPEGFDPQHNSSPQNHNAVVLIKLNQGVLNRSGQIPNRASLKKVLKKKSWANQPPSLSFQYPTLSADSLCLRSKMMDGLQPLLSWLLTISSPHNICILDISLEIH